MLMCVDGVLTSPSITQADPGRWTPHSKVVLSQLAIRASLRKHTKYLQITTMFSRWWSLSPYKDYSSLLRWQTNIYVLLYIFRFVLAKVCSDFGVLALFCCLWAYLVVCGFSRTIRPCGCFLCCLWKFDVST
jgi:hypothetical protein